MDAFSYHGIKIIMVDGKGREMDGKDSKIAYGIDKILIDSEVYRLILKDC